MTYSENFDELDKAIDKASKEKKPTFLVCPLCGSINVTYYMGMKTGVQYQCKDCDYVGAFIVEKDKD